MKVFNTVPWPCMHVYVHHVHILYLVRAFPVISNMVPCNNKSPNDVKPTQVSSGKSVNHFSQIRITASSNILVVDPSTSVPPGVSIVPVGGYNCTPVYTEQDCVGGVQWKVSWCIRSTCQQSSNVTNIDTAIDIDK